MDSINSSSNRENRTAAMMSADASFSYDEQQNHIVNNMMQVSMELCVDDVEGTSDGNGRTTHCDQSAADVSPDDMDTSSSNQEISETEYSRQTQEVNCEVNSLVEEVNDDGVLLPESSNDLRIAPVKENGRDVFHCYLCSFHSNERAALVTHLSNHLEHKCNQCDYISRTEGRLKQHMQRSHSNIATNAAAKDSNVSSSTCGTQDTPWDETVQEEITPTASSKSSTKEKTYYCKHCDFLSKTKEDLWRHARIHMRKEKILECEECPFVTEYKHHMDYHNNNHSGCKPFRCSKCSYTCVNKSMLNSHMKSHTNLYQYRCAGCAYATKYCHSMKLHLNKYKHKPAAILNQDGTVDHNTDSLLTMKRGGPRGKKSKEKRAVRVEPTPEQPSTMPIQNNQVVAYPRPPANQMQLWGMANALQPNHHPMVPYGVGTLGRGFAPSVFRPPMPMNTNDQKARELYPVNHPMMPVDMMRVFQQEMMLRQGSNFWPHVERQGSVIPVIPPAAATMPYDMSKRGNGQAMLDQNGNSSAAEPPSPDVPLDLRKMSLENKCEPVEILPDTTSHKETRQGKAFKLNELCLKLQEKVGGASSRENPPSSLVSSPDQPTNGRRSSSAATSSSTESMEPNNNSLHAVKKETIELMQHTNNPKETFECQHCGIAFQSHAMYSVHMEYHASDNPFKCSRCGEEQPDGLAFFIHVARVAH